MTAPADLLDRLLVASCKSFASADPSAGIERLLGVAADAFPHVAMGVRLVRMNGTTEIVCRDHPIAEGAERIFRNLEHERIVRMVETNGSTVHFAAMDRALLFPDPPLEAFLERLVMTIAAEVHRAASHADVRVKYARLQDFDAKFVHTTRLASFGQIAADIVHELNSPLTSVLAYADYLHQKAIRSGADPADIERLGRLHEAAERIHGFTRDLLAYARPRHAVPTAVAIHDVIEQALVFCDYVLGDFAVTVERAFGEVPAVRGIPDQLTQIFVNLFTNAAHAMREHGGRLTIQTSVVPGQSKVRVGVEDEGHGIAPEHLEKIFEPYFTTKPEGMGTGLGLSIVRSIVTAHGGEIRAYARTNQGAVFEVDLPMDVRLAEPAIEAS